MADRVSYVEGHRLERCKCGKHAPDPDCERPGHSSEGVFQSPAFYEEELRLLRNLYDELFSQTEQLRIERQQAIDALRPIANGYPKLSVTRAARELLVKLGERWADVETTP